MKRPTSTYRLQLRGGVDFDTAAGLLGYLRRLGIDWLYLSPAQMASPGSEHGYDVIDPGRFDPALGADAGFERLCEAARAHDMGILLDIVPNHMSARIDNPWWRDVLEHGRASVFAEFFDIAWEAHPESRVVLPILGRHYADALHHGELTLGRDAMGLVVRYHEHTVPLDPCTWPRVLTRIEGPFAHRWLPLIERFRALPSREPHPDTRNERADVTADARRMWLRTLDDEQAVAALDAVLDRLSGPTDDARSTLHAVLEDQPYRLCYWRSGLGEINYRRFFDIAELAALQTDREDVFERVHGLLRRHLERGCISGLRVDHVDGLSDPRRYLERLRKLGASYVVVEKILAPGEILPSDWPVDGTTGYELGRAVAAALTHAEGARVLHERSRLRHGIDFADIVVLSKKTVLDELFAPNVRRLAERTRQLVMHDFTARDVSLPELERALLALLAHFPVYRTYISHTGASPADRAVLQRASEAARGDLEDDVHLAVDFVVRLLLGEVDLPGPQRAQRDELVRRFQQLSGPVAAKGLEDTALYRWTALPGLSDVGSEPRISTAATDELFALMRHRLEHEPGGLNTTSSHDSKRSEDARCRMLALSQLVEPWVQCSDMAHAAFGAEGAQSKDEIDLLLQAYLAIVPAQGDPGPELADRLEAYAIKAAREAKLGTSWIRPNPEREGLIRSRVARLMDVTDEPWRLRLEALRRPIAFAGALDSLAFKVLQLGAPGVADIYRGTERWYATLVDPDNRRPVDFADLARSLDDLDARSDATAALTELRAAWPDGRIKTWVVSRGLRARREHRDLFASGSVDPVQIDGPNAGRVIAFERRHGQQRALVLVARTMSSASAEPSWPIGVPVWGDDAVVSDGVVGWIDVLTDRVHDAARRITIADVFADLPVALLLSVTNPG